MLKEIHFWPSTGRESLWATGEKVGSSKAHCEVQKQPNLDFSFRGPNPSPLLKSKLHMKSFGLDPWPPGSFKSPIFPKFDVILTKYIRNLKSAAPRENIIWTSTSLHRKNCRGVWPAVRLTPSWNCAFHHKEHPNFDHTYLAIPKVKSDDFFTKTKEATSSQNFYPFGTIGAQHWPSKSLSKE
jgi:hypothetical protein